jgi:hypothetical protein
MKENLMSTVIYGIECLENGRTYVGHSNDHKRRWRDHCRLLKRGAHSVPGMLDDWRTYGESAFALRVLEALTYDVEPHVAPQAILRWQDHFGRLGRLYNPPQCAMCGRPLEYSTNGSLDAAATSDRQRQSGKRGSGDDH